MTQATAELLSAALELPDSERANLAASLIESLDPESDAAVESAWDVEIQARIDEIQSGAVTAVPWSEARRQILEDADDAEGA